MKKRELAKYLWDSANNMRGTGIEANDYKDYVLGFIFYKYLSDREESHMQKVMKMPPEVMKKKLDEENQRIVSYCQSNLGYFIAYENLFSTWIKDGVDFSVGDVQTALSAFNRLIGKAHRKVFQGIFDTMESGLTNLGKTTSEQTKNIRNLLYLINDIPTDGRQGYDVLGYIYEYLISNFAANAGKKAGEFYTPHEVSQLMSDIIAHHLQGKDHIEIYDPTSGSGSLLITIGKSISQYMKNPDGIKYYAQEVKPNTFNLTRMNLVMRGIKPDNIVVRLGDTLEADWPIFDEADPAHTYEPLYVDAVVANPPYSLKWHPENKETEPRFQYGLAPKSKADYAFLQHNLFHIQNDGIVAIVLPHGVLFRGDPDGEGEGMIRKKLIENNHVEAIIGLPANIFFGTGIPTIIMILKKSRPDTDVLFIDASQGFVKDGKNNRLLASHIRRIVDAVIERKDIPHFARRVTKDEIRQNNYNLNIPRYVSVGGTKESWDIYATVCGGIPNEEIDQLDEYWNEFPQLRHLLFTEDGTPYSRLAVEDVRRTVSESSEIQEFRQHYADSFAGLEKFLYKELVENMMTLSLAKEEDILWQEIRHRIEKFSLINLYGAYQLLDDSWNEISVDLETLQTEGWESVHSIDPSMLPFKLVQEVLFPNELAEVRHLKEKIEQISEKYSEIIDSLSAEEQEGTYLNEDNTAFKEKETKAAVKEAREDITSPELEHLSEYLKFLGTKPKKAEKMAYVESHPEIQWDAIEGNAPYGIAKVKARIKAIRETYVFPENSLERKLICVLQLMQDEKAVQTTYDTKFQELQERTISIIKTMDDETARDLLRRKWIVPLLTALKSLPQEIEDSLTAKAESLADKYRETAEDIERESQETGNMLADMMTELTGREYDEKGLAHWRALFTED